ncbi:hypothetical protein MKZ27_20715 [Bacillus sp. FSL R5-0394]|uniref:hypothetical protein n=1 Tax=Shouchella clausii TaxID=79880 RepID=UPI000BA6797C|nr:hypothetical protein [Shouchella clausii]PAF10172.1 hypothetical protein CHH65_07485 [Shouchella clausii]
MLIHRLWKVIWHNIKHHQKTLLFPLMGAMFACAAFICLFLMLQQINANYKQNEALQLGYTYDFSIKQASPETMAQVGALPEVHETWRSMTTTDWQTVTGETIEVLMFDQPKFVESGPYYFTNRSPVQKGEIALEHDFVSVHFPDIQYGDKVELIDSDGNNHSYIFVSLFYGMSEEALLVGDIDETADIYIRANTDDKTKVRSDLEARTGKTVQQNIDTQSGLFYIEGLTAASFQQLQFAGYSLLIGAAAMFIAFWLITMKRLGLALRTVARTVVYLGHSPKRLNWQLVVTSGVLAVILAVFSTLLALTAFHLFGFALAEDLATRLSLYIGVAQLAYIPVSLRFTLLAMALLLLLAVVLGRSMLIARVLGDPKPNRHIPYPAKTGFVVVALSAAMAFLAISPYQQLTEQIDKLQQEREALYGWTAEEEHIWPFVHLQAPKKQADQFLEQLSADGFSFVTLTKQGNYLIAEESETSYSEIYVDLLAVPDQHWEMVLSLLDVTPLLSVDDMKASNGAVIIGSDLSHAYMIDETVKLMSWEEETANGERTLADGGDFDFRVMGTAKKDFQRLGSYSFLIPASLAAQLDVKIDTFTEEEIVYPIKTEAAKISDRLREMTASYPFANVYDEESFWEMATDNPPVSTYYFLMIALFPFVLALCWALFRINTSWQMQLWLRLLIVVVLIGVGAGAGWGASQLFLSFGYTNMTEWSD